VYLEWRGAQEKVNRIFSEVVEREIKIDDATAILITVK